jgi:cation transport ATPase
MSAVLLAVGVVLLLVSALLVVLADTLALAPLRADGAVVPRGGVLLAAARHGDAVVAEAGGFATDGELQVVAVEPVEPDHDRNLRWFAGALEHQGEGPVSRAISRLAGSGRVTDVRRVPGAGIEGSVDRHPVRVGDPRWLGVAAPTATRGGRTVAVEVDGRMLGSITVADRVRPEATGALTRLTADGWTTTMVSSAGEVEAQRLAAETGGDVRAVADADGRRALVAELAGAGRSVVWVAGGAGTVPAGARLALTDAAGAATTRAGDVPVVVLPDVAVDRVEVLLARLRGLPGRLRAVRLGGGATALAGAALVVAGVLV